MSKKKACLDWPFSIFSQIALNSHNRISKHRYMCIPFYVIMLFVYVLILFVMMMYRKIYSLQKEKT